MVCVVIFCNAMQLAEVLAGYFVRSSNANNQNEVCFQAQNNMRRGEL